MAKQTKTPKRKGVIRRLFADMGKYRRHFWLAFGIIIVIKICLAAAPKVVSWITDMMQQFVTTGDFDYKKLLMGCAILALLYFIGYGADGFINRTMVFISQNLLLILRNRAGQKLNRLTIQYSDNHPLGDTQSRVTNDMVNLSNGIESTVASLLGQGILMVAICVMMLFTNVFLALIFIIAIPLTMIGLRVIARMTNKMFKQTNMQLGKMNSLVSDSYSNHTIIKAYDRVAEKEKEFDEMNREFERLYVRSRFTSGFMRPFGDLMAKASYILLCLIGGIMMMNGHLTLGEFMAFLFYGNMIGVPITELSVTFNNFQDSLSSAARIYDFLDEDEEPEEEPTASLSIPDMKGKVSFDHVKFGYVPEKTLMEDVSFTAKPGQTMAIVGPSGAGKTTLINLLMRFYDIQGGTITLDDIDTKALSKQNLRSAFGMVLQETWIFDGTIAENIAFGKPGATREEVIAAAKTAYCDSFIERLPDGYDTYLSNENSALSAGEKQLLSIARAIIADPKVLILDEATSQVDTKTEEVITRAMQEMMKGRTSFIIAHRLYTIRNADQIIFMVDGDIKEVGSHEELLQRQGYYASMYAGGVSMGE
ncbi:MAG: ABC transporter ATP-binding protein [Ruminococcus sp.]|nr:ABC transporter ATP-binding protein [Ruminococcus sp.]